MNDTELQDALKTLLEEVGQCMDADDRDAMGVPDELGQVDDVSTFNDAGVLTSDRGLVVTTADGCEFQLTIVQSR